MAAKIRIPGIDFLREVKVELSKVIWPSRLETVKLTTIVIVVTIIVGFFVLGIDYVLAFLLKLITRT
ncbi:preprotein translocase subunit SecE [Candidatus Daviesbacteria bacterium RIFCSPHIGHO2_01_FULL_44_29]|uniref:Protein translocase subunit SecE n=1 Tax=Candidatus Daviesbacteria bacterium RIFCSPHIGHO2_02_FULL_43_12 TaxID=1797776 RepID=A0A1F5KIP0_9BACT|nr:MAG: preprotein translocase subunit SecE [Candidatus Daviesbacteria bacterium RIFCSPHIGHO2_01_FULL_44_29]OGE40360.1 MAG: preprotein translocase subunit SecE [Candidatus Daviesbacteria bacterium RIFCSPHIGHO2_12_FULL_47_45]OGE40704.1 MAG: preprotein translocase subunit SecE [Candidatus Daviesbacteria bacterium RIFCSPHIGHO2_02_FULL_43_12]OGE69799.1 MAG: preprotein translocase subunit SecE [Candidatus Daviesbacteria bacterium RIFCSPLOWO2_01_FULL_43_15]